jgi:hypothetical protein
LALIRRVARHGVVGTIRLVPTNLRHLVRSLSPAAIADRRRDREFDRLYGTKTSGVIPLGALDVPIKSAGDARWYGPTTPEQFDLMMRGLPDDLADFTFIDYGSGLGRALILASRYPFKEIIGVEFSQRLHQQAEANLRKFRTPDQRCCNIKSLLLDAREFAPPAGNSVFFFNAPFGQEIMSCVLKRIEDTHQSSTSRLYVLYQNAHEQHLLRQSAFWIKLGGSGLEWAVFARPTENDGRE